jgi:hypothetical protein
MDQVAILSSWKNRLYDVLTFSLFNDAADSSGWQAVSRVWNWNGCDNVGCDPNLEALFEGSPKANYKAWIRTSGFLNIKQECCPPDSDTS